MPKTERIQVRIDKAKKEWLIAYAKRKKITISRIFVDFTDWLRSREEQSK